MAKRPIKFYRKTLLTCFLLAGLILLIAPASVTGKFQLVFAKFFQTPLQIGRNIVLTARPPVSNHRMVSSRKYNQLKNHAANLRKQLDNQRQQYKQLNDLYNEYLWEDTDFALGGIIHSTFENGKGELLINRGGENGIEMGQYVIGDNCAIGFVSAVTEETAKITLFTDSSSQLPVLVGDAKGLLKGIGDNLAKIGMISTKHELAIGDEVFAVQKSGYIDSNMKVGEITELRRNERDPLLWDILVTPSVDFSQLNDVAVIIMHRK